MESRREPSRQAQQRQLEPELASQIQSWSRSRHEARAATSHREFLRRLMVCGGFSSEREAEDAAIGVLCALEQRLSYDHTRKLLTQLPSKLRLLMARCKRHEGLLPRDIHRSLFLQIVAEHAFSPRDPLEATEVVFEALAQHVSAGEIRDLIQQLPGDLRELWPDWARGAEPSHAPRPTAPARQPRRAAQPEPPESAQAVVHSFLRLTPGAQFGVIRTILPRALAGLSERERLGFLRDLGIELELARYGGPASELRSGLDEAPESPRG